MTLDATDVKILNALQKDAKITNKQLGEQLHLSPTAVFERIKKLEKSKLIKNYAAILDRKVLGKELLVIGQIRLVRHSQQNIEDFEKHIKAIDEIKECFHISGDYDYVFKAAFRNMDDYHDFMVNKLTTIPSIGNTHTLFIINEVKNEVGYNLKRE
ncbi:MAG: Lrp/AsnC family transcriptional regulator [Chitinophagaceae bacterium]|nr:Lrp/AsnC family transcriptional regulator [Chitinophagaceae bacterium]